jgi:hypothetical protein
MGMAGAMGREVGRQLGRRLADEDSYLFDEGPPTEGEMVEDRRRAMMVYSRAPPVGAGVGLLGATALLLKTKGSGVLLGPALPIVGVLALATVAMAAMVRDNPPDGWTSRGRLRG